MMQHTSVTFRPGIFGLIPDAWIVTPPRAVTAPPVVVVHGITRNVEEMIKHLTPRAEATGRTLILPHFSRKNWPRYRYAACKQRSDLALMRLMSALAEGGHIAHGPFDLSGFSAGAQFAHRFTWLHPTWVGRLCATAPGWWTFPDPYVAWPYGMGDDFRLHANLRRFLDRRIVICIGSDDTTRDKNLRQGNDIDTQQGPNRYVRAQRWQAIAQDRARDLGLDPAISLRVLLGCGHDFAACVSAASLDMHFIAHSAPCRGCSKGETCRSVHNAFNLERNAA